jgi:membrane-bound lytic murein transglycosylase B
MKPSSYTLRRLHWFTVFLAAGLALGIMLLTQAQASSYLSRPEVREFIARMVSVHGFDKAALEELFADAEQQESALEAIARPAEAKPWHEYCEIFITDSRVQGGIEFWAEHANLLRKAERVYGVPPEIIVAIIGVETYYGAQTGGFPVFDTLVTLGFDYPPRADFFKDELEQFLLLTREEKLDSPAVEGSYAGAMGMGQFISSSYRQYAVDFDGDGQRSLWDSTADAIGSVANYFRVHGWEPGAPVAFPVEVRGTDYRGLLKKDMLPTIAASRLPANGVKVQNTIDGDTPVALLEYDIGDRMQYWIGLNNFYVITRYNRSSLYAMAVHQLSQAIKQARDTRQVST